jgi:hypothetical protein
MTSLSRTGPLTEIAATEGPPGNTGDRGTRSAGDRKFLDSRPEKKGKTAAEYVAGLSSEKRKRLRARLEELLAARDASEESEEPEEEEL